MSESTQCKHTNLYPLMHSSFNGEEGTWTHCNDCGEPVEITTEMKNKWYAYYQECVNSEMPYQGVYGYNDPDGTMPPMA
jgi:hypothetical protein